MVVKFLENFQESFEFYLQNEFYGYVNYNYSLIKMEQNFYDCLKRLDFLK